MKKITYLIITLILVSFTNSTNTISNLEFIADLDNPVYVADNGITIKAKEWAKIGATGIIAEHSYTVVNEEMLREMLANEEDLTRIATSKVTNMSALFYGAETFNQAIGNWDLSKVTTVHSMFYGATSFNQNLGAWNVDAVTDCNKFSYDTPQWRVSKPVFTNCTP
jgi:surface protein